LVSLTGVRNSWRAKDHPCRRLVPAKCLRAGVEEKSNLEFLQHSLVASSASALSFPFLFSVTSFFPQLFFSERLVTVCNCSQAILLNFSPNLTFPNSAKQCCFHSFLLLFSPFYSFPTLAARTLAFFHAQQLFCKSLFCYLNPSVYSKTCYYALLLLKSSKFVRLSTFLFQCFS